MHTPTERSRTSWPPWRGLGGAFLVAALLLGPVLGREAPGGTEARPRLRVQVGHGVAVSALEWSPQGHLLASAGFDGTARLWDAASGRVLRTLSGHQGWVRALAWSPDERLLATGSEDGTARIWVCRTGRLLHTLAGHRGPVVALAWSPDGRSLVTAGNHGMVRVWDVATGQARWTLFDQVARVESVAWSPDGRLIAASGWDEAAPARIWDAQSGRLRHLVVGHEGTVWRVAWSPDGTALATASMDGTARVWDAATGQLRHVLSGHAGAGRRDVWQVAWNPEGTILATTGQDGTTRLWDAARGQPLRVLEGHANEAVGGVGVAWSSDGCLVATRDEEAVRVWDASTGHQIQALATEKASALAWRPGCHDLATADWHCAIRTWDPTAGRGVHTVCGTENGVTPVAWGPADLTLTTENADGTRRTWQAETGRPLSSGPDRDEHVLASSWSPDGRSLATGRDDGTVRLRDVGTGRTQTLEGHQGKVWSVAWSPDGRTLATAGAEEAARLWDAATGRPLRTLGGHGEMLDWVTWSPDGRTVATSTTHVVPGGGREATVWIWDAASGRLLHTLAGHPDQVRGVSWSPDGRTAVTLCDDWRARVWDRDEGRLLHVLEGHDGILLDAAWSPDSRVLATTSVDGTSRLWDARAGVGLRTLKGHGNVLRGVAWSPDGRRVATASTDGTARIWDPRTGETLQTLNPESGWVSGVAWSSDGRLLATGGEDGTARIWFADSGLELAALTGFPGGDWAVVSPDGFFDGTPGGLKQLHWVIGLESAELERFFLEFYQPGLLRDVLQHREPVSEILAGPRRSEEDHRRARMTITRKDRRAVQVAFDEAKLPKRDEPWARRTLDLVLRVAEAPPDGDHPKGSGLKDLRVFRNGVLVWRSEPGEELPSGPVEVKGVPLVAGENRLVAYAFNGEDIKSRDADVVVTGAPSLAREPRAHVLAVGIDRYQDPALDLNFAVSDARDLAAELERSLPVPRGNVQVKLLLDGAATRERILGELDRLAREANPEDVVIVSFAGHGIKLGDHFYLIPQDQGPVRTPEDLALHGVGDRDVEEAFAGLQAERVALVIDACQSGQALQADEWRTGPMNTRGLPQLAWEKGLEILTASQSDEAAREDFGLGHGLLTFALLEGFRDEGSRAEDGSLPARTWLDFGAARVSRLLSEDPGVARGLWAVREAEPEGAITVQTPRVFHGREDGGRWVVAGPRER